jgi:hypothetical protein
MSELLSATESILDAYSAAPTDDNLFLAAIIRAIADQVVPLDSCGPGSAKRLARHDVRYHLLAIAEQFETK